jgi:hypothetical protein
MPVTRCPDCALKFATEAEWRRHSLRAHRASHRTAEAASREHPAWERSDESFFWPYRKREQTGQ